MQDMRGTIEDVEGVSDPSLDVKNNRIRETQISLLAYSHIVQSRFTDTACLLVYKMLVRDICGQVVTKFTNLLVHDRDGDRLRELMRGDEDVERRRAAVKASVDRLRRSVGLLGGVC